MPVLPYKLVPGEANTPQWLEARKNGISASDTPNIMIPSEAFGTPCTVYAQKVLDYEIPVTAPMQLGHVLEPIVAKELFDNLSRYLPQVKCEEFEQVGRLFQSKKHPWLLATPDYAITRPEDILVEIKTTHERNKNKWRSGAPLPYQLQVQQQLLVTGIKKAIIFAGFIRAEAFDHFKEHGSFEDFTEDKIFSSVEDRIFRSFEIFTLTADEQVHEEIVKQTAKFWNFNVAKKIPPQPRTEEDIKLVYPPVSGKKTEAKDLAQSLLRDRQEIEQQLAELTKKREKIDYQLKLEMLDAEILTLNGKTVATWKQNNRRIFDSARFKQEHEDLYAEYRKTTPTRTFLIKK